MYFCLIFSFYNGINDDKIHFIKIRESFSTVFPWIWLLSRDSTKPNNLGFVKNYDAVSQCENETEKSRFFG